MALFCPATLLIARSDEGSHLTDLGREQVRALAEQVRPRRIAKIFSSRLGAAVESAELASSILGGPVEVLDGLEEVGPHGSGAESEAQDAVIARYRAALEEVADQCRGENALVFSHDGVMAVALPRLAGNVRSNLAERTPPSDAGPAELAIGDDGWVLRSWPGVPEHVTG